jgi:hypothetical protein
MNCEALAEIILDLARGTAVPEEARLGARRHMETCPSCAAHYARQLELTETLQELVAEAQDWTASPAMEQRLLAAFAAHPGHEPAVVSRPSASRWRYVLATAAVLTLAVWGIREAGKPTLQKPATMEPPVKAGGQTVAERTVAAASAGESVRAQESASAGKPGNPRIANPRAREPRTREPRPAFAPSGTPAGRPATPVEFVRIPSAIGLPELESGTVVRMELPLAALPEYGLDIAPDAARTSVEADVLVGQDGQPRAIRLIARPESVAQDPRSRQ